MTFLLSLLLIAPFVIVVALRASRARSVSRCRTAFLAVARGRQVADVVAYTEACAGAACLVIENDGGDEPGLGDVVRDTVVQIQALLRAAEWRAWVTARSALDRRFSLRGEFLVWTLSLLHPDVVAAMLSWRGKERAVCDLNEMTRIAVARFKAAASDDDSPLLDAFVDVLLQQGVLTPEDLAGLSNDDEEDTGTGAHSGTA